MGDGVDEDDEIGFLLWPQISIKRTSSTRAEKKGAAWHLIRTKNLILRFGAW